MGVALASSKGQIVTMIGPNGAGKTTLLERDRSGAAATAARRIDSLRRQAATRRSSIEQMVVPEYAGPRAA